MDPTRWQRVDSVLAAALEVAEAERPALLDRECAGDPELRREVESLLAHDRDDDLLETGAGVAKARLLLATPSETLVGRTLARFELEERLGSGGMGDVYRARDPLLDRDVAVKRIRAHLRDDPTQRRRFRHEALAASALNHPNIVTVHDIVELTDGDLLVTELVDGVSLRQRLREGPRLPVDQALDVAIQAARGLAAAHAVGIVHRDVKPGNLMIRPDGLVKVLDFGIAKALRVPGLEKGERETEDGTVLGTIAYMSPEQARGRPIDARTDLWSLGVVLYEMLTGARPFGDGSPTEQLAAILEDEPEPLRQHDASLPAALERIVASLLSKDREQRPRDAERLIADLERVRGLRSDPADPSASPGARTARASLRPRRIVGLSLALALAAGALLWRFATSGAGGSIDSIAVLPFRNVTENAGLDYLADGLADSLIRGLAELDDLTVISRTSAFRYRASADDPGKVARELGVRAVVTGLLSRDAERLALDLELVDGRNDAHLWGDRYEFASSELSRVRERIRSDLGRRLDRRFDASVRSSVAHLDSENAEAYELYLQGRYYWYQPIPELYHQSREYFVRAIELDPRYALAWAGLGHYYGYAAAAGLLDPDEYWPRSEQALSRMQELEPGMPEAAPLEAAITLYWQRDWNRGLEQLRRAAEVFPDAINHLSIVLGLLGRFDEAVAERQRDFAQDPSSIRAHRLYGTTLYFAGRFPEAETQIRRALDLEPKDVWSWDQLGDTLYELGRPDEAADAWERALRLTGRSQLAERLHESAASAGPLAAIQAVAEARLEDLEARRAQGEYVSAYDLARQHLRAGHREEALRWAVRAFDERNRLPLDMVNDPVFVPLRGEPAFREGVRRLGLPPRPPAR